MVQPSYPRLQNAELIRSVGRLVDALPFYKGSPAELTEAFIHAAGDNFSTDRISEIPPDILDLRARIVEYADDLARHVATSKIGDVESLLADFVWFLTQPLNVAERDVKRLELSMLAELSQHEAMGVTNIDFRAPDASRRAEDMLGKFIERVRAYPEKIDALMRRVSELERVFRDPDGITLRMRGALRDIGGMIMQLDDAAHMVLELSDNDILRAKWLKKIHTVFDDRADPFGYDRSIGKNDGVATGAGADSALAGAFGLAGGAQVIPLRFGMSAKPVDKA